MKRFSFYACCLLLLFSLSACSDQAYLDETDPSFEMESSSPLETSEPAATYTWESLFDSYESESSQESDPAHTEHTEFDPYYESSSSESFEPEDYPAPENWRELYPNGSAGKLDGTVVVISIFAGDQYGSWDSSVKKNSDAYARVYYDLRLACEYLSSESAKYDKNVTFLWDWMSDPNLTYETEFDANLANVLYDYGTIDRMVWEYIEKNVNSEGIRKRYEADSVIYMVYANSPSDINGPSCTRNFYAGMPYPYEICYIQMNQDTRITPPSVFAHEMLHTFGAPDIYWTDIYQNYSLDYGITKEYVKKIANEGLNDIMRITWDPNTGKYLYHSIAQSITEITAYYVGLTDYSETVETWGFQHSQHDQ